MRRRDDAQRYPHGQRDQQRPHHQQHGGGETVHDLFQHRLVGLERFRQVQLRRMPQPAAVLHQERIVQPVFVADRRDAFLGRVFPGQRRGEVAGHQLQQAEHHERGQHDHRHELQHPPPDKPQPGKGRQHRA